MPQSKRYFHGPVTATILNTATLSDAIDVPAGMATCLVEVPTITSAAITLQVSYDGTNFRDLYNVDDTQQGRTTATTGGFMVPFVFFGWVKQLKVKSGAAQGADRTLKVSFLA